MYQGLFRNHRSIIFISWRVINTRQQTSLCVVTPLTRTHGMANIPMFAHCVSHRLIRFKSFIRGIEDKLLLIASF